MHNPDSVLENETHKILGDFDTQTDHLITIRGPDQVIEIKNRELAICGLCRHGRPLGMIEGRSKRDKYQNLAMELKKYGT